MPDFSTLLGSNRFETIAESTAASRGTALTAPGSNNTKGAYAQLVAASAFAASGLIVTIGHGNVIHDSLVDIAVGAASSEVVVAANLLCSTREKSSSIYMLPIPIPAGSRISARYQTSNISSTAIYANVTLIAQPFLPGSPLGRLTAYGVTTADSGGTAVDPGGTANTKGSYSQITSSTTNRIRALLIGLGVAANATVTAAEGLLDIAVGAAASEQIVIPDLWIRYSDQEHMSPQVYGPFLVNIPAGTRLAARAQCSITDATDRLFDVVVYGLD